MTQQQVLALGFFDGVHLGHGVLLRSCRELADRLGVTAAALTFDTHPDTLVTGKTPGLINSPADREKLMLERFRLDRVLTLHFDEAMMHTPWQDFFRLLLDSYHAAGLVCGHDFRFGDRGAGNAEILSAACREAGIPCIVVPEQKLDGITVSSTHIRALLEQGDMTAASRFLGHPHMLSGTVIRGRQLGRTWGIPTANLILPEGVLAPRLGVYACRTWVDGKAYAAVTNVGTRPTVGGHQCRVEAWLLDFEGDLYGRELTLEFLEFLRPETKFPSSVALQAEIRKNAEQTREFFAKN